MGNKSGLGACIMKTPMKAGRYRLIALYYYAAIISSGCTAQLDIIQKALAMLPEDGNPEDRSLLGFFNLYRSLAYLYYLQWKFILRDGNHE